MTLTPEQFNIIATKDDLKNMDNRLVKLEHGQAKIINTLDGIVKMLNDHESDRLANVDAHDVMQGDVNEVRKHVGLKIKHPTLSAEPA